MKKSLMLALCLALASLSASAATPPAAPASPASMEDLKAALAGLYPMSNLTVESLPTGGHACQLLGLFSDQLHGFLSQLRSNSDPSLAAAAAPAQDAERLDAELNNLCDEAGALTNRDAAIGLAKSINSDLTKIWYVIFPDT